MTEPRRKRVNGEASRERILDAAAEIAGERGFEGTSISLVSQRSGLPASSIYWHFADKDDLIAAVIERSFRRWAVVLDEPVEPPPGTSRDDAVRLQLTRTGAALGQFPDFLRLGLMLILERRPEEPTARKRFLEVRATTAEGTRRLFGQLFPELGDDDVRTLVTLAIALADGLFVDREAGGTDLGDAFDLMATAVLGTAARLAGYGRRTSSHHQEDLRA